MCHDKTKKKGRNPALTAKWQGPYVIMEVPNPATAKIQKSKADKGKIIHVDWLKHAFPPDKTRLRWAWRLLHAKLPDKAFPTLRDTDALEGGSDSESSTGVEDMVLPPLPSDSDDGSLLLMMSHNTGPCPRVTLARAVVWSPY